ncbi:hypothetical protein GCM10009759_74500 [Kitasatospora saccharophila]|uniref:Uncharacterized protein n=1 Tax=Kitasatospora saccharophila TaxID=407973 RepID=A0ABN2Y884_9ACTN
MPGRPAVGANTVDGGRRQWPPQQPPVAPPHWQGAPDWQPQPQPGPQPQPAARTGRSRARAGAAGPGGGVVGVPVVFMALPPRPGGAGQPEGSARPFE